MGDWKAASRPTARRPSSAGPPRSSRPPAAAIFDMDGVLVDSNPFHLQKMADFLAEHHIAFHPDELPKLVLGQRNDTIFRRFFGPELTEAEMLRLSEELEERFRRRFRPHAKPLPGLSDLVDQLDRAGIPMAVASSAMEKNVRFVVGALGFGRYFRHLVSGDEVACPKPDPEIYLKAAEKLGVEPAACVGFEDSFPGISAVKSAGMKCVAIASTFSFEELMEKSRADCVVRTFAELNLAKLRALWP